MPHKRFTLTDVDHDVYVEQIELGPGDVGGSATGYSIVKRTLHGGLREGIDVVEVNNGTLQFTLLPTRGMGIWRGRCGKVELGWKSPVKGPVHPALVPVTQPDGLGFLYGFDEFLCRCGLQSMGAPEHDERGQLIYPLHGRIANLPAHLVEVEVDGDTGDIRVSGVVDECRFLGYKLRLRSTISTRAGSRELVIRDEVTNLSTDEVDFELLYHTNFGPPLLEAGARVVAPVKIVVPHNGRAAEGIGQWDICASPEPGFEEQVYLLELAASDDGRTQTLLRNAGGNLGVSLRFDTGSLPCFTVWKNTAAEADGYVTGLEPGTSFPNAKSFERAQGRVPVLPGGGTATFELAIEVHTDAAAVAEAEQTIARLRAGAEPQVHSRPLAAWCDD